MRTPIRSMLIGLTAILIVGICGPSARGRSSDVDGKRLTEVRTAFVLKFLNFVTWPEDRFKNERSPLVIGIVGPSRSAEMLRATLADRRVGQRPLRFRMIQLDADEASGRAPVDAMSTKAIAECHVLYVPDEHAVSTGVIWPIARTEHVLMVVDERLRLGSGGMIAMPIVGSRVGPVVNLTTLKDAEIQLSSRLLQLAEIVERGVAR